MLGLPPRAFPELMLRAARHPPAPHRCVVVAGRAGDCDVTRSRGRPQGWRKYDIDWWRESYNRWWPELTGAYGANGVRDRDICECFGVSHTTLIQARREFGWTPGSSGPAA